METPPDRIHLTLTSAPRATIRAGKLGNWLSFRNVRSNMGT